MNNLRPPVSKKQCIVLLWLSLLAFGATAVTEAEHDTRRKAIAERYDRLNATLREQYLRWNSLMAVRMADSALKAKEAQLLGCDGNFRSLGAISGSCDREKSEYLEQINAVRGAIENSQSDRALQNILAAIDGNLKQHGADPGSALDAKTQKRLCSQRHSIPPELTYRRFAQHLIANRYKSALGLSRQLVSEYSFSVTLQTICSSNVSDATYWKGRRAQILRELIPTQYVESALNPRTVGSIVCIDWTKQDKPFKSSRHPISFSQVCSILVESAANSELNGFKQGLIQLTAAVRTTQCQDALSIAYEKDVYELIDRGFNGSVDAIAGCNIRSSNAVPETDRSKRDHLRRLLLTAISFT